jgi:hypothetical protein
MAKKSIVLKKHKDLLPLKKGQKSTNGALANDKTSP